MSEKNIYKDNLKFGKYVFGVNAYELWMRL